MTIWQQLLHILAGHPHLIAWFRSYNLPDGTVDWNTRHFVHIVHLYPHRMHHLLGHRHYCHWLLHYLRVRNGLPGDDLLLGA